jgi:hypothetical protein
MSLKSDATKWSYHNDTQVIPENDLARRKNTSHIRRMLMHFLIVPQRSIDELTHIYLKSNKERRK